MLVPLNVPVEQQTSIRVVDFGTLRFYEQRKGEVGQELKSIPAPAQLFVRPRDGTPQRQEMLRILNLLSAELARLPNSQLTLQAAQTFLSGKGCSPSFVDGVLRSYASSGMLRVERDKNGVVYVRPTASSREIERRRHYSAAFASDLTSQSDQLRRLIGHKPSVGAEREELLRALLERHVPKRYHVASGFIEGFTPQIDIIVYDQIDYAPIFKSGNLVVIQQQAVRAIIEVKSDLDSTNLQDALDHLSVASLFARGRPPIFRGIFAFTGCEASTIAKGIRHFHRQIAGEDDDLGEPVSTIEQMVSAVCVLEKAMVQTGFAAMSKGSNFPWMPATMILESDAGYASQAGVFFDHLDRFLRCPYEGAFERQSLMDEVRDDLIASEITPLYSDEEWVVPVSLLDEEDILRRRIEAYNDWLQGEAWRTVLDEDES